MMNTRKEDDWLPKVKRLIDNAKDEAKVRGVQYGLRLYPALYDALQSLHAEIPNEFNLFNNLGIKDIITTYPISYIISTLNVWNNFSTLSKETKLKIDEAICIYTNR